MVAELTPRSPIFTRGYVTCTTAQLEPGGPLEDAVAELSERYRRGAGDSGQPLLPPDAEPLALVVLTTHEGHFLGSALSHVLAWRDAEGSWTEWVASKTTGAPDACIWGIALKSLTSRP